MTLALLRLTFAGLGTLGCWLCFEEVDLSKRLTRRDKVNAREDDKEYDQKLTSWHR